MSDEKLHKEIFAVARHLYERTGGIQGRDLDNWLEAEKIVTTLRKIAGNDGKKYILINVPAMVPGKEKDKIRITKSYGNARIKSEKRSKGKKARSIKTVFE